MPHFLTSKSQILPVEPTPAMLKAIATTGATLSGAAAVYAELLAVAPHHDQVTMTKEEYQSSQVWKGMDGVTAWHLIFRHADGWEETGQMMEAWLDANRKKD
jgi:hypothetical protein